MPKIAPVDPRLSAILLENARALFAAYDLDTSVAQDANPGDVTMEIAGTIGFTGAVRGTVLLASTKALFSSVCPPPSHGDVADWTAELANQLLGRFKNRLVKHGIAIAMATPVAVRGLHISCATGAVPAAFHALRTERGDVLVGIEALVDEPLVFADDKDDDALDEGALELF